MAKQYSQSQWAQIMKRLPEEDRTPYSTSPDAIDYVQSAGSEMSGGLVTTVPTPNVRTKPIPRPVITQTPARGVQSAGSEMSGGGVTTTPTPMPVMAQTGENFVSTGKPVTPTQTAKTNQGNAEGSDTANGTVVAKKLISTVDNKDGTFTNTYDDGTTDVTGTKIVGGGDIPASPGAGWQWDAASKKWIKPAMPQDGTTYTWNDAQGWVKSPLNTATTTATQVDSIAAITALLSSYGIGDLGPAITAAVMKGYSGDTINLIMQDPNSNDPLAVAFQTRFPANKIRLAAGKSVLSASEYLAAERTYTQVLQSYGVGSMAKRDTLNSFISNDISAAEVSDRVSLAVNRVQNADADTKAALKQFYPMLNQSDIVSAMLSPTEGLPALQRKVQIGEIGGAAMAQNLTTGLGATSTSLGAQALADLGITQAQARQGFSTVAEITPRAEALSNISPGEDYGRLQAEQEQFQGLASAKRARLGLTAQEQARFGGSAGTGKGSLTKTPSAGQY